MESTTREIFRVVGIISLLFGGVSVIALFFRVVVGDKEKSDDRGIGTLWGLFLIATALGLLLIALTD